jgi:hypothetical protein
VLSRAIYKKQRGRRLLTALAAVSVVAGTLLVGSAVLAVNATGAFELDGNASTLHGAGAPDDADRVCYQNAINPVAQGGLGLSAGAAQTLCTANAGVSTVVGPPSITPEAASWADATVDLTIFTGGGSKDPQDPGNSWLWKPKDTIPDKDTIDHAFAARYALTPNATTCPSNGAPTCEVIFFGVDRFDNSGDAQLGFWFFKTNVGLTNTASQGGFKFSGHHVNGDLLVLSDFSIGGTTSTIAAYFWDTSCGSDNTAANKIYNSPAVGFCGANNLRLQGFSAAANCATSASTSAFCGIANGADGTTAPWSFTDKSGNHSYLKGEYYEAGINLSALNIGNECFSSFVGESRSSTSPTATLKDFVLHSFQPCSATAVTTPTLANGNTATSVSPGTPVTDHIVITGTGTGSPPNPSSPPNVNFSICGPITAPAICDAAHSPTAVGTSKPLAHNALPQGKSEATSDAVNTSGNPLLPGRYCFSGSWAGDTNYPAGASDNGLNECFTVIQIGTTTVTTPSDSSGTGLGTGSLALGTVLYDKAVVTADQSGGGDVTGTVAFFLCNPSQVTGAAGSEVCASGGTNLSGNPRTLVPIAASNPPASSVLSSPGVAANVAGVWCFRAVYTPSGSVYTGSSDATHGECVTVGPETTTTVTTPSISSGAVNASVTDHAVVTAFDNSDGTPTGTINFFICNPTVVAANGGDCSANGTAAGSKTATAVSPAGAKPASEATSDPITANVVGTWCFRAVYVPGGANGGNYTGSSDSSTGECFLITDTTGATSAQNWLPNDSATITSVGGTALNGTLHIKLYTGDNCGATSGAAVPLQDYSFTLTNEASGTPHLTTNSTYLVTATGAVSWKETFTSSDPLVGGSSRCQSTSLTISN